MHILPRSWTAEASQNHKNLLFFCSFCYFGQLANKRTYDRYFGQLGFKHSPNNFPKKGTKGLPKSIKKGIQNMMQIGLDFGALLGRFLVDFGFKLGAKLEPIWTKNPSKRGCKITCNKDDVENPCRTKKGHARPRYQCGTGSFKDSKIPEPKGKGPDQDPGRGGRTRTRTRTRNRKVADQARSRAEARWRIFHTAKPSA